jgi:hypothetical protein
MWASSCSEGVSKGCAYLLLTGTGVISMLGPGGYKSVVEFWYCVLVWRRYLGTVWRCVCGCLAVGVRSSYLWFV